MSEQMQEQTRNARAVRTGEVVSAKGDKTLVVMRQQTVQHIGMDMYWLGFNRMTE